MTKTRRRPRATRKRKPVAPALASPATRAAGFDCGSYPGDFAVATWADMSPYAFVGFYLDAPCHTTKTFKTWSGKYQLLRTLGLGLAVVYVGYQQDGCGSAKLSRANGALHGQDTIAKCETEGFPRSTIVFLDVENFDGALSTDMGAYISGWIGALLDEGSVRPGIYCPARKAAAIQALAAEEYLAHGIANGSPAFWIVKVDPAFDPASSAPAGCGVAFASIWQGRIDVAGETHGGVSMDIDQNVATSRDPSGTLA